MLIKPPQWVGSSVVANYFAGGVEPSVAQAPLPLQLFLPACLASPPPWPLQSFFPLQECLPGAGAGAGVSCAKAAGLLFGVG